MAKPEITQQQVRNLLNYDPDSGHLFWKVRGEELFSKGRFSVKTNTKRWNTRYSGKRAGSNRENGYRDVTIGDNRYKEHRVIFLWWHGFLPKYLDHIDHNRSNNKINNLRGATKSENCRNQSIGRRNTSGVIGVYWDRPLSKWYAQIRASGKTYRLGSYTNKEEAIAARKAAEVKYNFHNNHGVEHA